MTRLYLSRNGPTYTPPTIRGAWEGTSTLTRALQTKPDEASQGESIAASNYEVTTLTAFDVMVIKGVTAPLAADYTFGGTLNLMMAVQQSFSNSSNSYYLHAYVTVGASDVVRGTLLANYFDSSTNDWTTTAAARPLQTAQALTAVAALAGDRIVVELGFRAKNGFSSQQFGYIYYSGGGADLVAGGAPSSGVGYIDFSDNFTLAENQVVRVTQLVTEVVRRPTNTAARLSQLALEVVRRPAAPPARISQMVIEVVRKNGVAPVITTKKVAMLVIAT